MNQLTILPIVLDPIIYFAVCQDMRVAALRLFKNYGTFSWEENPGWNTIWHSFKKWWHILYIVHVDSRSLFMSSFKENKNTLCVYYGFRIHYCESTKVYITVCSKSYSFDVSHMLWTTAIFSLMERKGFCCGGHFDHI